MEKLWRTYGPTAGALLVLDWFLLSVRSFGRGWDAPTTLIFKALNFPWSSSFFSIEAEANPWWSATFGKSSWILNDELGPMILLLIIVGGQAAVFTVLISGVKKFVATRRSRFVAAKI